MKTSSLSLLRTIASAWALSICVMAAPPRVAKSDPAPGARDVDPGLKEIRVTFDQPMLTDGSMSIVGGGPTFPNIVGRARWADDRTLVISCRLQPNHEYWLSMNSQTFTNFKNPAGDSAVPYPIPFHTAGGASALPPNFAEQNREAFEVLKRAINEDYSYRDLRRIDWESRFAEFAPRLRILVSPDKFAESMAEMLSPAQDVHMWLKVGDQMVPTYKRQSAWNVAMNSLPKLVPGWKHLSPVVFSGEYPDGVRYLFIRSWPGGESDQIDPAFEVITQANAAHQALIVDVRANGGGAEPLAQQFAGCFVDHAVPYAKDTIRYGGKFSEPHERVLEPNKGRPHFQGQVAVLMGLGTVSSSESFVMMMKQVPGCLLIGDRTAGASGNPKPVDLGNGVTLFVPSWKDLRLDGTCMEGEGFAPDVAVKVQPGSFVSSDPVIQEALNRLKKH